MQKKTQLTADDFISKEEYTKTMERLTDISIASENAERTLKRLKELMLRF